MERTIRSLQAELEELKQENDRLRASQSGASPSAANEVGNGTRLPVQPDEDSALGVLRSRGKPSRHRPFPFPEVDLPWSPQNVRLSAPGDLSPRAAPGDWLFLFRNAAPYIAAFRGGTVVVHMPSFMFDQEWHENFKGLMEDVAFCSLLGLKMILVSSVECRVERRAQFERSSGSQASRGDGGSTSKGQCVGNAMQGVIGEHALRIAKQEAGFARVEVESALSAGFEKRSLSAGSSGAAASAGIFPVRGAVSVVSSMNFYSAAPLGVLDGVDYGYAGVVRSVNTELLERRLRDGDIVSLAPLGASSSGEVFFVSSEALAATVAKKLGAMKIVYITRGQRLFDPRDGCIIPGIQVHHGQELLQHLLRGAGSSAYSPEVRESLWFQDSLRHLRHLVSVVSPKGVQRGHLVDPAPGALLQEFYTTDGSGTVIAPDMYQGLGRASVNDVARIKELLEADDTIQGGRLGADVEEEVKVGCMDGEFFVWKRDEVVLGCGQLVGFSISDTRFAELRYFAVAERGFASHALALFGYAERAAVEGGASVLVVHATPGSEQAAWFAARGCATIETAALNETVMGGSLDLAAVCVEVGTQEDVMMKNLGEGIVEEAAEFMVAFSEEQRMWGNVSS